MDYGTVAVTATVTGTTPGTGYSCGGVGPGGRECVDEMYGRGGKGPTLHKWGRVGGGSREVG